MGCGSVAQTPGYSGRAVADEHGVLRICHAPEVQLILDLEAEHDDPIDVVVQWSPPRAAMELRIQRDPR